MFMLTSLAYLVKVFPRKILLLLMMECFFLFCLAGFSNSGLLSQGSLTFFLFLLMLFMVLDSVFGITLMVSISRFCGPHSSWFM